MFLFQKAGLVDTIETKQNGYMQKLKGIQKEIGK
jgi:hypothetical protein